MMSRVLSNSVDFSVIGRGFCALEEGFEIDNMSLKTTLWDDGQRTDRRM